MIFVPEAYSIEVGFSAENDGESVDLSSSFDVDTGVSVNEESEASFDQVKIENTRSVSGTGHINAAQTYSGSGGYKGSAILSAQGAAGTLHGNAFLTPEYLSAKQDISLTGDSIDTGMSLSNKGDSANLGVTIKSGMISSSQSIETGSVNNQILANIEAQLILYRQLVNILGNEVNSLTKINTPTSSPVVLNGAANSYTGSSLAYTASGGNINVDDSKKITGPAGSEVNIDTQVTNAKSCDYKYYPNSIYSQEKRTTLTAKDADYIFASASAGKDWMYPGHQYATSMVSVNVNHGSLEGYSNKAYFDGTNFIASQSANSASGISSGNFLEPASVSYNQHASNAEGDSAVSGISVSGEFKENSVKEFSGTATSTESNVNLAQTIGKASGDVYAWSGAYGPNFAGVSTSSNAGVYVTNGALNGYSNSLNTMRDSSASSQYVQSASGNYITMYGGASTMIHSAYSGLTSDWSSVDSRILDGFINGYSQNANARIESGKTYTTSSQDISFAKGNLVSSYTTAEDYREFPLVRTERSYIDVTNGDLSRYHDKSTAENGVFGLSQSFDIANGNIEASRSQQGSSFDGLDAGKSPTAKVTNGFMSGYSNDAYLDNEKISFSQGSKYASGDSVNLYQHISDQEGNDVHGSVWADKGSVDGYYSTVNAIDSKVDFTQEISSATGSQVFADSTAAHMENGRNIIDGQVSTNLWNNPTLSGYHSFAESKKGTSPLGGQDTYSATSSQDVDSASGGSIYFSGTATKYRADGFGTEGSASASTSVDGGSVGYYSNSVTAEKISPVIWADTSIAKSSQNIITASGNSISVGPSASNGLDGESANIFTEIVGGASNGQLKGYFDESKLEGEKATASATINHAQGTLAEISSHGENRALGYENQWDWVPNNFNDETPFAVIENQGNWEKKLVPVHKGEGDFAARKANDEPFNNIAIRTEASQNEISISSTGFGTKTALILDPCRWEFENSEQRNRDPSHPYWPDDLSIYIPIKDALERSDYAITYYSDAAVSKEKVNQMQMYRVSAINTHGFVDPNENWPEYMGGTSTGFVLSKSSDSMNHDEMYAKDIKYQNSDGLIIFDACSTFKNRASGTLAEAVSKAGCSGGTMKNWNIAYSRYFLINFFDSMSNGNSVVVANGDAGNPNGPYLSFQGNRDFRL